MVSVRSRHRVVALAGAFTLVAGPVAAGAATKNGITPLAPQAGAKVAEGKAATFRMRVHGKGKVFVHVCKSTKKANDGTICPKVTIGQAVKHDGVFVYKQKFYDFPAFWLNTPGTYYWQAYRIECGSRGVSDCRQESPVVKFRVG